MTTNPRLASRDPRSEARAYAHRPCDEIVAGSDVTQTDLAHAHRRRFGERERAHAKNDSRFSRQTPNGGAQGADLAAPLQRLVGTRSGQQSCLLELAIRNCVHSSMSSALTKSDGGIVTPSIFAVDTLMESRNLVGSRTGRSAGFAPFRMLSTKRAACLS